MNDTNVSTLYADSSLVQGKQAAGESVFDNNFNLHIESVKDVSDLNNIVSVSVFYTLKNDVVVSDDYVLKLIILLYLINVLVCLRNLTVTNLSLANRSHLSQSHNTNHACALVGKVKN